MAIAGNFVEWGMHRFVMHRLVDETQAERCTLDGPRLSDDERSAVGHA